MGLRERKKEQVRLQISHAATELIIERGFDAVSVSEIAERAGVSRMTVFNYFPRKEDMFFDRVPLIHERITAAVRSRPEGRTPQTALRDEVLRLMTESVEPPGHHERMVAFWKVANDSPALRARAREIAEELEEMTAGLFAERPGPIDPKMSAALLTAACRVCLRDLTAGEASVADVRTRINRAFDIICQVE
ncbi:TetR family transcriptional regulator [Paractinoplanes abujensis]|uniref:AcrR family transcriptional regulator n=1 Tax=Paractinoplanes abujensis TaxID=882441 RepID=A0A7W7G5K2_9ACTN|nr:TetR/AcrR family transcriptional regulator [Actinoplanes abujensis]MBB4694991.1 AcrR family transcriptional regulator [Actinoplanes abujensis]GID23723.1 TetR family transcriptional regulator [Actinoplanes abujensis]